jgi:glycosidase
MPSCAVADCVRPANRERFDGDRCDFHLPPKWVADGDAIFYQIFPDRFAKSERLEKPANLEPWADPPTRHGYKGGDLIGVVEHLDYLTDLGINAIYFNPVFQSASNHRYHTHDYFAIDPLLGGGAAFDEMLAACRDRGIRVVLDGVFNHASRGFFQFSDILENGPSSAWLDWFHVNGWPLRPYSDTGPANYEAWWGLKALPKFNTDNPEVREFLMRVGEHWASKGIDGWRLDVPQEIQTPGFWEEFRERVRAVNPDCYIVGEIWSDATYYVAEGTRFDATMNYQVTTAIISYAVGHRVNPSTQLPNPAYEIQPAIDAATYGDRIERHLGSYPEYSNLANLNLLDSHDTARIATIASGDVASAELAMFLLLTFPGAPSIYYGSEIGLEGGIDPDSRRSFPWDEADWNPDLRSTVKSLIALRIAHPALRAPGYRRIWPPSGDHGEMVYVFERRSSEGERIVGAVNAGDDRHTLTAPAGLVDHLHVELIWGDADLSIGDNNLRVSVPSRGAAMWLVSRI